MTDFIWCFTKYEHWRQEGIRRLWILDVPEEHVRFVDTLAWESLVHEELDEISEKAAWARLLVADPDGQDVTGLVPIPIREEWVIERTKFNKGPRFRDAAHDNLPESVEEASSYRPKI